MNINMFGISFAFLAVSCIIDEEIDEIHFESRIDSSTVASRSCDQGSRFSDGSVVEQIKCTSMHGEGVLSKMESDCRGFVFERNCIFHLTTHEHFINIDNSFEQHLKFEQTSA